MGTRLWGRRRVLVCLAGCIIKVKTRGHSLNWMVPCFILHHRRKLWLNHLPKVKIHECCCVQMFPLSTVRTNDLIIFHHITSVIMVLIIPRSQEASLQCSYYVSGLTHKKRLEFIDVFHFDRKLNQDLFNITFKIMINHQIWTFDGVILTELSSSPGPAERWGDGGDPVGLLLLPGGRVWSCICGRPALPPPAARQQLRPWSPAEEPWVRSRWGTTVQRKMKKSRFI